MNEKPHTLPPFDWDNELRRLPDKPGVYRMYDADGDLIYIGKAKAIKNRVRQYFQKNAQHTPKVLAMVEQVDRFDYVITHTEVEALILEATLVKQHLPKFNILLRDDKKYPWIGLSADPFPRIFITRDPGRGGRRSSSKNSNRRRAKFFGPYISSRDMYLVLEVIKKHFPLRQRPKPLFKDRPCMNYFIGTCPGPCQNLISEDDYAKTLREVELFLKGRSEDLLETLARQMESASESLNFELAAKLRDRYVAVQNVVASQKVFYQDDTIDQDIISACADELRCAFNILSIRRGKLIASRAHEVQLVQHESVEEVYSAFIYDYYDQMDTEDLPDTIVLQYGIEDEDVFVDWLNQRRREFFKSKNTKLVTTSHPEKGDKQQLLEMSFQNATDTLEKAKLYDASRLKNDPMRALISLQEALDLPVFPQRMECYDISHFQGGQTVASMVVFTDGVPDKAEYRRFKIKTAEGKPDDFKSMYEVISRRVKHMDTLSKRQEENPQDDKKAWPDPDLIIIDGGKGQLGAALDALKDAGITDQPMVSLAKKFEEVFKPYESRPVLIERDAPALYLLQQIRDEAHRFAITYHRSLRAKVATTSVLDNIPGVGAKTRTMLLKHFGSLHQLEKASLESLLQLPGLSKPLANTIYQALHAEAVADEELPIRAILLEE